MVLELELYDAKILLCISLSNTPLTVHKIAQICDLSASTVSNRTRNLEKTKIIYRGKEGRKTSHFLTDTGKESLEDWKQSSEAQFFLAKYEKEIKESIATSKK